MEPGRLNEWDKTHESVIVSTGIANVSRPSLRELTLNYWDAYEATHATQTDFKAESRWDPDHIFPIIE